MANTGSTGVGPLTLNIMYEGLNPAAVNTGIDKMAKIYIEHMVSGNSTGVEQLTQYLKFEGSNPATTGTGREKTASTYLLNA
jgi:hypothetical protein